MGYSSGTFAHCHSVSSQVYTGTIPFSESTHEGAVFIMIAGERPPRPTHQQFTDQLWTLMQRCWDQNPHSRPEVSEVVKVLRGS